MSLTGGSSMFRPQDEICVNFSTIIPAQNGGLTSNGAPEPAINASQNAQEPALSHETITNMTADTKPRDTWGNRVEFLLTCVAFAVGLGNVWRFPYLAYQHGGGAFLIPYIFFLAFLGLPIFFLELAIGQYASLGPISVWKLCPLFKGIGYTMITISVMVSMYYNVIIGYTLYYFFASFTNELPWSHCNNTWNTPMCHTDLSVRYDNVSNPNIQIEPTTSSPNASNITAPRYRSPAEEYWTREVLKLEADIDMGHLGEVRWHLALCLLLAWIIVYLCIIKGIRSSGKVVYFTASFPYFVLVALFFRGVTLPGASKGISFYLVPDFNRLASAQVWKDAAVQILYSLGAGSGGLLAMSSYNKFNNNCLRDAVIVATINCSTSIFAGFVIFSVLGYMAHVNGVDMEHVIETGPGLAFIVYPEAITHMSGSVFWSLAFFFMLFTLGLGSQFPGIECISTAFTDEFPVLKKHKPLFTAFICFVMFLFGLSCVTQGGQFVITLIDRYATSFPLLIVVTLECCVISWIYGYKRFSFDIELMIGYTPNWYWLGCWMILTPILTITTIIAASVEFEVVAYSVGTINYVFPKWTEALGWLIMIAAICPIPIMMLYKTINAAGSCKDFLWLVRTPSDSGSHKLSSLLKPTDDWGPALTENKPEEAAPKPSSTTGTERQPIVMDECPPGTTVSYAPDSYI